MDRVRRIPDAVLYEGYVLWPYRRSAVKNQRRWTFGGVYPQAHSALHPDDACVMQTQCLARAKPGARLRVRVRFLHVVERRVARLGADGREPVDELTVDGERYVPWQEATEREVLHDAQGSPAGTLTRSWRALTGNVEVAADPLGDDVFRITVRIANETSFSGDDRERALRATFCSTHTVLTISGGDLLSLTDPPPALRAEAQRCENIGTWPVLAGEPGELHTILSAPIILPDHPEIAPESPGDLFDAAEIDQLLTLSILSMTGDERAQMRAADPRTRAMLERTESLSREELMRLHGTIRERG